MQKKKFFTWKLEIQLEVDEIWVADGYYPDRARIEADLVLSQAYSSEFRVKVKKLSGPSKSQVAKRLESYEG
jgi:hypothetical protein